MNLPAPIQAYFNAENSNQPDVLISVFASDAVVQDEGRSHLGHSAIAAWWTDAKARYRHSIAPFAVDEVQDDACSVRARVTGLFPGSPATLTFAFRLTNGEIARLEICA